MRHLFSRRRFLSTTSMALPLAHLSPVQQGDGPGAAVAETFPQQAPAMVREAVVASHGNVKRIRELVDAHPAMARAARLGLWRLGGLPRRRLARRQPRDRGIPHLEGRAADDLLRDDAGSARCRKSVRCRAAGCTADPRTAQHSAARARPGGRPGCRGGLQLSRRSWRRRGAKNRTDVRRGKNGAGRHVPVSVAAPPTVSRSPSTRAT